MGLFNKKQKENNIPVQAPASVPQPAPQVSEASLNAAEAQLEQQFAPKNQEVQYAQQVQEVAPESLPEPKKPVPETKIRQVPVFLDQSAINNLIIENNLMLKELLSMAQED